MIPFLNNSQARLVVLPSATRIEGGFKSFEYINPAHVSRISAAFEENGHLATDACLLYVAGVATPARIGCSAPEAARVLGLVR